VIIAFSGLDGSGKTTCAEFTVDYLKSRGFFVKYLHIIKGSLYHKILHGIIARVSEESQKALEKNLRSKENKPSFFISKWLKKGGVLINLLCFNLLYGRYKDNIRRNIVTDRYFYDDIVQAVYLGIAGRSFLSFCNKLIIQPDLVFFLKADPAAAYARKREYDEKYFMEKSRLYADTYKTIPRIEIPEGGIDNIKGIVKSYIEPVVRKYE
jgi:thymidylate kinase